MSATDNPVDTAKFSQVMYLFTICPVGLGTQHEAEANPAATLYEKLELVGMSTTGVVPSCFGAGGLVKSNTYFKLSLKPQTNTMCKPSRSPSRRYDVKGRRTCFGVRVKPTVSICRLTRMLYVYEE